jgi:hypothetical protein
MTMTSKLSAIAAATLLAFSGAAFSQTVNNGTFAGPDQSTAGVDNIAGWNSTGAISTRVLSSLNDQPGQGVVSLAAPPGGSMDSTVVQAWYLSGSPDSISQSISGLTIGKQYTITFDEAAANRGSTLYNGTLDWQVSFGGHTLKSDALTIPGVDGATSWVANSLTFTADAATEVLAFLAQSSVGVAPEPILLLDNVSISSAAVAAVPEPGTYALMFAGLGIMGFVAKRRKGA